MSTFHGGPADGKSVIHSRAPVVLRVVQGSKGWDVLDQLDDQIDPNEIAYVYRMRPATTVTRGFWDGRGGGGMFADGTYDYWPNQPPQDVLADNKRWDEWCQTNKEKLLEGTGFKVAEEG